MDGENSLIEHKWVRIMCDSCADGLWDKNGAGVDRWDLPVPHRLHQRIRAWQDRYERFDVEDAHAENHERSAESLAEWQAFDEEGLAIAKEVKKHLPHWTVVFFHETRAPPELDSDRSAFEYEIGAGHVKLDMLLARYLQLRHVDGTDGLWDRYDQPIDAEDLPLSPTTLALLSHWRNSGDPASEHSFMLTSLAADLDGWTIKT